MQETGGYFRQLTNKLLAHAAAYMSDELIADVLFYALQCNDITDAERREIQKILDL